MTAPEKRLEERLPLESATLPLLGSRQEDFQPFQYLVQDLGANGVRIAIPSWAQQREILYKGDAVNLHLPYQLSGQSKNQGIIAWEKWDLQMQIQSCGIILQKHFPERSTQISGNLSLKIFNPGSGTIYGIYRRFTKAPCMQNLKTRFLLGSILTRSARKWSLNSTSIFSSLYWIQKLSSAT
jgi:hypothetical protein